MNSSSDIHESDVFCVLPAVDRFRWVCRTDESLRRSLPAVRYEAVGATWAPLEVMWAPETIRHPSCDFPNLHPILNCMSIAVTEAIAPYLSESVELLALEGLGGNYTGVHCIRWIDAANLDGIDVDKISIYATSFVPTLKAEAIGNLDFFGVEGMVAKLFVSAQIKRLIEANGLTGCEFHPVPLC